VEEYSSERETLDAAFKRLQYLEETQPPSSSGGQRPDGIQDRVYIQALDRKLRRIMPRLKE